MMTRLGGGHVLAVLQSKHATDMPLPNHNGLDVDFEDAVRTEIIARFL
jgi:hypothetical protein